MNMFSLIKSIFFIFYFLVLCVSLQATNYYINGLMGDDSNKGTNTASPWKTISPVAAIAIKPGDSILFAAGQKFTGMLSLLEIYGSSKHPVVITGYPYQGNKTKPVLDAGNNLNAILIQNASFIKISGIEITASAAYQNNSITKAEMRCGILVEVTKDEAFSNIVISDILIHDVYYHSAGYKRSATETASANGTQSYGWGIRFINNTKAGLLTDITVVRTEIFNVSHTGLKFTATTNGIKNAEVSDCKIHDSGGPGLQLSGVNEAHIHHNTIDHSGSVADSRNWGRGSGMWTWGCSNILIEHNRFENANGPGDSAGVHIDYNCSDVIVQYNVSANNAGGFCEILGNNYNCAYRYNISINDGYRIKGNNGAFQEGKIFWLSGYVGNNKGKSGPFNSYFYNNSIYVSSAITPRIAVSSSSNGVLIANNIFYFEKDAIMVKGDQKKTEMDTGTIPGVIFSNNLFLSNDNWPKELSIQDASPVIGDPGFKNKGGYSVNDYLPLNTKLVCNRGTYIQQIPMDKIGLRIGLKVKKDILGNNINGLPDLGAIEINDKN
jgi:Right handed beta helix region